MGMEPWAEISVMEVLASACLALGFSDSSNQRSPGMVPLLRTGDNVA